MEVLLVTSFLSDWSVLTRLLCLQALRSWALYRISYMFELYNPYRLNSHCLTWWVPHSHFCWWVPCINREQILTETQALMVMDAHLTALLYTWKFNFHLSRGCLVELLSYSRKLELPLVIANDAWIPAYVWNMDPLHFSLWSLVIWAAYVDIDLIDFPLSHRTVSHTWSVLNALIITAVSTHTRLNLQSATSDFIRPTTKLSGGISWGYSIFNVNPLAIL